MSKNVVFIVSIKYSYEQHLSYEQYCLSTWKWWCDKNDCELFVLEDAVVDPNVMKPNWQKMYAFDILDFNDIDYNQVAIVDVDTMIKWNTPNFFNMTDGEFSAVVDDSNVGWVKQSIDVYKQFFKDVDFDWTEYFNSGFMVLSKKHKEMVKNLLDFWNNNLEELTHIQNTIKKGHDQTPINYMVRQMGFDINFLSKTFNLTHLNRKEVIQEGMFIDCGYIWHFNGFDKGLRKELMEETWDRIKKNYEN